MVFAWVDFVCGYTIPIAIVPTLFWRWAPLFFSMSGYNIISLCFTLSLFSLNSCSLPAYFYPSWILVISCLFVLCRVVWAFLNVYVFYLIYYFCHLVFWSVIFISPPPPVPLLYSPHPFACLCALLPFHIFFLYPWAKKATSGCTTVVQSPWLTLEWDNIFPVLWGLWFKHSLFCPPNGVRTALSIADYFSLEYYTSVWSSEKSNTGCSQREW